MPILPYYENFTEKGLHRFSEQTFLLYLQESYIGKCHLIACQRGIDLSGVIYCCNTLYLYAEVVRPDDDLVIPALKEHFTLHTLSIILFPVFPAWKIIVLFNNKAVLTKAVYFLVFAVEFNKGIFMIISTAYCTVI